MQSPQQTHPTVLQLQRENESLRRELTELRHQLSANSKSAADRETLLQAQLNIFKEDFESERRDRERAQSKFASLEAQIFALQQQLQDQQLQQMENIQQRRKQSLDFYKQQYQLTHGNTICIGADQSDCAEGYDEVD